MKESRAHLRSIVYCISDLINYYEILQMKIGAYHHLPVPILNIHDDYVGILCTTQPDT